MIVELETRLREAALGWPIEETRLIRILSTGRRNHRVFRHSGSDCVIVLPDNRDDDAARPADIAGVRDHLAYQGHLEEPIFNRFLSEGKLPAA